MKLADALVTSLRDWDVRYVFGVSGANIEHLHDAIHRLGDGRLTSVLAKSEVGAAFMADCRARVHSTLGVCCATSGGGMMNLAVGVAEAFAESVPMLALVGQPPRELEGQGAFQDSSGIGRTVDAKALFGAIAKHVIKVESAHGFWEALRSAVQAALSGRPGPAVMLIPRDVFDLDVGPRPTWLPASLQAFRRTSPLEPAAVRALFEAMRDAKRPVLVLGTGVERSRDGDAVRAFAERASIPLVTTMGSLGSFPHAHPLFLGAIGAAGHPSAHDYINEQADLLVAVGTGLDIMTRKPLGPALKRCAVAVVNIDPGEVCRATNPSLVVQADAGETFRVLGRMLEREQFHHQAPEGYVLTRYRTEPSPVPPDATAAMAGALLQSEAVALLQEYLPADGHLLFDAGNCAVAALHGLEPSPGVSTTIALGMGGMGYAVAGAIGAQLGATRGRTVVLCGDGAFLMQGLELHTAVEHRLSILFVVFNNGGHGMCVTRQNLLFDGRIEATRYAPVDINQLSRGLGAKDTLWTATATTRENLASTLQDFTTRHSGGPGVLEIVLRRDEIPPFGPFLDANVSVVPVPRSVSARSAA
jgi:acetolactate synthase-1/2/3 large subunit